MTSFFSEEQVPTFEGEHGTKVNIGERGHTKTCFVCFQDQAIYFKGIRKQVPLEDLKIGAIVCFKTRKNVFFS